MHTHTVIIGGGLAGLACASTLHAAGAPFELLEASDRTGGRVRTDACPAREGPYRIDRGFQVLLTAYPHAARLLDLDALDLRAFYPGAMVFFDGTLHRVADPRRRPGDALTAFKSPIATMADQVRLAEMALRVLRGPVETIWSRPDRPAIDALIDAGFAQSTIDRFFRPFFGGVFFDGSLQTSSRMLEFCFRMFAQGRTCIPSLGMGMIAEQLTTRLPRDAVNTNTPAVELEPAGDGRWHVHTPARSYLARQVVLATEGHVAARLAQGHVPQGTLPTVRWRATATLAYACRQPPTDQPVLVLDGHNQGPVNHLACMSAASRAYAPDGWHLVYANVIDQERLVPSGPQTGTPSGPADQGPDQAALDEACRQQLTQWFGPQVQDWRLLRVVTIPHALPDQRPPWLEPPARPVHLHDGLFVCGDWRENASIDGALASGLRCAQAILDRTSERPSAASA